MQKLQEDIEKNIAELLTLARTGPFVDKTIYEDVRQLLVRHERLTEHRVGPLEKGRAHCNAREVRALNADIARLQSKHAGNWFTRLERTQTSES